ncbi:unnamed protein product [Microthlaspi erraticum]|uniref:Uncharacterized protein n=1 Tax=Microthlaspi erraticum TaxID=1685480 RepID=A0A6D2I515_9BRAS|nr:unnamed protein product [Microthlaspi erraticum]
MITIAAENSFERGYAEYFVKPRNLVDFIDIGRITVQILQTAKEFKDIQGDIFAKLNDRVNYKANSVMQSLMSLAPQKAIIAETGEEVEVDEVKLNTIVAVEAGETIPVDGNFCWSFYPCNRFCTICT